MKNLRPLILSALLLLLAGCGSTAAIDPTATTAPAGPQPSDIRGTITNVQATADGVTITITGQKEADTIYPEAVMRISGQTKILDAAGQPKPDAQLAVGQRVEASYSGPVSRSLPPQGTAGMIRIIQ